METKKMRKAENENRNDVVGLQITQITKKKTKKKQTLDKILEVPGVLVFVTSRWM